MVLVECFCQSSMMRKDQLFNLSHGVTRNTTVAGQRDGRFEPEFAFSVGCPHVDVRRFLSFIGVEVKT